jgi:Recombinase
MNRAGTGPAALWVPAGRCRAASEQGERCLGQRAHRLEPDLETDHVVRWIFAQRLAGQSMARIAQALNDAGIPCPSASDPARDPSRTGAARMLWHGADRNVHLADFPRPSREATTPGNGYPSARMQTLRIRRSQSLEPVPAPGLTTG